jgi:hypothetical protein
MLFQNPSSYYEAKPVAGRITKGMGESFRPQIAATSLQDMAALLELSAKRRGTTIESPPTLKFYRAVVPLSLLGTSPITDGPPISYGKTAGD